MGTAYRARVDEREFPDQEGSEGDTRNHLPFLGPESVLRLVEYMCPGKPMSPEQANIGARYLVPLIAFVNGVEWTFVFLRFTGHLR